MLIRPVALLVLIVAAGAALQPPEVVPATSGVGAQDGQWGDWEVLFARDGPAPPAAAKAASLSRPKTSEITVTYRDFPEGAQKAFEHAASILETQVTSDTEVLVAASWVDLGSEYILGRVSARWNVKDPVEDPDLPRADVMYPSALASAFRHRRLDDEPDIEIELNSESDWYTGVDGSPGLDEVDLVTVALHEMIQGYGFHTSLNPFVAAPRPTIFDLFVAGPDRTPIYTRSLEQIWDDVTSEDVVFTGPAARVAAGGTAPHLYAPRFWEQGSSITHLGEYYLDADPDALMAPALGPGWAFHDPGPITLAILNDLGWTVSGLGTATRLTILQQEPKFATLGRPLPIPVQVVAQDPIGVSAAPAGTPPVTIEAWGRFGATAAWSCPTGFTQPMVGGRALFNGCTAGGDWELMFLVVTSPGLASGMIHVFTLVDDTHATVAPGLRRSSR